MVCTRKYTKKIKKCINFSIKISDVTVKMSRVFLIALSYAIKKYG